MGSYTNSYTCRRPLNQVLCDHCVSQTQTSIRVTLCLLSGIRFLLSSNAFILWNNEAVVYYWNLCHGVLFHVLRGPRPQDAGTLLLLPLEIYNLNCSAWEHAPRRRVTKKSRLFYTNCRSGRNQGSNPGHLRGRQQRKPLSHPLRLACGVSAQPGFGDNHRRCRRNRQQMSCLCCIIGFLLLLPVLYCLPSFLPATTKVR
jgi:hypothetical protein